VRCTSPDRLPTREPPSQSLTEHPALVYHRRLPYVNRNAAHQRYDGRHLRVRCHCGRHRLLLADLLGAQAPVQHYTWRTTP
jgi:hypothetical protein